MRDFYKYIIFFLFLIYPLANSYSQNNIHRYQPIQEDFSITLTDGTVLDCTKFYPDTVKPSEGWPAIIFCHGYGLDKYYYFNDAIEYANSGYYVLCYSMRGQGNSGGLSNLISTTEMNDFTQVVQKVKNETLVNPNMVGAIGASQGGTIPLMACCNGLNLQCLISDVSSPEFASSWIENKSIKMTLLWSLSYPESIVRYNSQVKAYRDWILADTRDKWDSLAYYLPLNRNFSNKISQNTTAFLAGLCWQDKFFNPYGFLKQINYITSPYRMYLGTFGVHGADSVESECNYYKYITNRWTDYFLKNIFNHSLDSAKFIYASSVYPRENNLWAWQRFYTDTYPPAGVTNVNLYLQPNGRLYDQKIYNNPTDNIIFLNDVKDNTLTMTEAVNYEFTGSVFDSKFSKTQLVFDTKPLLTDTRMIGTPLVNIHYFSSVNKAQFNVQIWEIKPDGSGDLVTRANYTDRNILPNVVRQITFFGTSSSHVFLQGNTIRVIITNLDNTPDDPFLRTNPYVLPSLLRASNTIFMNISNPTYVQLPLIGFTPISVEQISSDVPDKYFLGQNYPNPFNPTTIIRYSIPTFNSPLIKGEQREVTLKVFDILGKEIATLVNEKQNPGTYEVKFDARHSGFAGLPSGIYFYRLVTGNFSETKRMLMIK